MYERLTLYLIIANSGDGSADDDAGNNDDDGEANSGNSGCRITITRYAKLFDPV